MGLSYLGFGMALARSVARDMRGRNAGAESWRIRRWSSPCRVPRHILLGILTFGTIGALDMLGLGVSASTYYFSDCATGGSGTQPDPYCLDPAGDGVKDSFRYLADGVAPELAAGDTVFLCAGACDGIGTATYGIQGIAGNLTALGCSSNPGRSAFFPRVAGTQSNPITIAGYPGETVVLSGDTNNNGVRDTGTDLDHVISTCSTSSTQSGYGARPWYVIKDVTMEKTIGAVLQLAQAPNDWVVDHLEIRRAGSQGMWDGLDLALDASCDNNNGNGYALLLKWVTTRFTFSNNKIHHLCGFGTRITDNLDAQQINIVGNEIYNCLSATNDYANTNIVYRGNYIHDCYHGIAVENMMHNITIEDNRVSCEGIYKTRSSGSCGIGILATRGDTPGPPNHVGDTSNLTIRRNKVWAVHKSSEGVAGWFQAGILWEAGCVASDPCSGPGGGPGTYLVENNFVWNVETSAWCCGDAEQSAIIINSTNPVTVQNNTVYGSGRWLLSLNNGTGGYSQGGGYSSTPVVNHIVRNNLLIETLGSEGVVMRLTGAVAGSTIRNNNILDSTPAKVVARYDCYHGCASVESWSCAALNGGALGTNNKCTSTTFTSVSGPVPEWNLHLIGSDSVNKDAGTPGPIDDIDLQKRWAPVDIGADEQSTDTTAPAPPQNVSVQQ